MKILIAISSCARDAQNGYNQAVRDTWIKDLTCDYKFMVGETDIQLKDDEVRLPCPDDYLSLPYKTLETYRWALENGYDFIFKCDTDTFIRPEKLLSGDFHLYDYYGSFNGPIGVPGVVYNSCYSWTSGGSGYWVSRKAAELIIAEGVTKKAVCPNLRIPCEDLWIGQVLGPKIRENILTGFHDDKYGRSFNSNYLTDVSSHYCSEGMKRKFDTNWMYKHYEINKNR